MMSCGKPPMTDPMGAPAEEPEECALEEIEQFIRANLKSDGPECKTLDMFKDLLKDMNDLNLQLLRSAARDKILAILDTISWDDLNQTAFAKQIDIEDYIYTSLSELPALGYTNVPSRDIINLICSDDRVVEHVYGGNSKLKQLYNFAYGGVAQSAA